MKVKTNTDGNNYIEIMEMKVFCGNPGFWGLFWILEGSKIKTKQKIVNPHIGCLANNPKNKKIQKTQKSDIFFDFSGIKIF